MKKSIVSVIAVAMSLIMSVSASAASTKGNRIDTAYTSNGVTSVEEVDNYRRVGCHARYDKKNKVYFIGVPMDRVQEIESNFLNVEYGKDYVGYTEGLAKKGTKEKTTAKAALTSLFENKLFKKVEEKKLSYGNEKNVNAAEKTVTLDIVANTNMDKEHNVIYVGIPTVYYNIINAKLDNVAFDSKKNTVTYTVKVSEKEAKTTYASFFKEATAK